LRNERRQSGEQMPVKHTFFRSTFGNNATATICSSKGGVLTLFFIIILTSASWAQTGKTKKTEIEIPVNIGIGPALFWIPGVVDRELHTGAQLELYAAITPKVLQENKNKIPKKYQKYVSMEDELHIRPLWLGLIPKYIVISPGEENSMYGAIWSFFGLGINLWKNKLIKSDLSVNLPSITYLYAYGDNDPDSQHIVGAGGLLKFENTFHFSESFLATLAYAHNFNIPFITTGDKFIHSGILSLVFNFRFGMMQKI